MSSLKKDRIKRTERGWPGHFICVDRCFYRRNTLVEYGEVRVVVSTVGGMKNRDKNKVETIGHNRYYETMVFMAFKDEEYWEANVSREVCFDSNWFISKLSDDVDNKANEMHEKVVREIMRRIKQGTLVELRDT